MTPPELESFKNWDVPLPTREPHGTEEDVRANLRPLKPQNWRMQGNWLIADTEFGELSQRIDPAYILTGTDEQGLPVFRKV